MSASTKAGRWRLAKITIGHFRGVAGEQCYAFDGHSGLLHGDNGVGKSTVALALQWILFGRFPTGVLQNTVLDRFLSPVGQKGKPYTGEAVFVRNGERAVFSRDEKHFAVEVEGEVLKGDDAAARRDTLLGLDMDTFVRAVLLQQSRVRSLLLDEPKERNKALDRLLGMDVVERLVDVVRPREFETAARHARAGIDSEKREFEAKERLLAEQLVTAQDRARTLDFKNKDLNPTGLEARYVAVSTDLLTLAKAQAVEVEALPGCSSVKDVPSTQKAFTKIVRTIRLESETTKRAAPLDLRMAALASLSGRWQTLLKGREQVRAKLAALIAKHGDAKTLTQERTIAEAKVKARRSELKAANALQQLLADSRDLLEGTNTTACPVCEQALGVPTDLPGRLRERIDMLASDEIKRLQGGLQTTQARIGEIDEALAAIVIAEKDDARMQGEINELREKATAALGGVGTAESKLQRRLEEELAKAEAERTKLKGALEALEDTLHGFTQREGAIRDGLVPVLLKRDEVAAHAQAKERLAVRHEQASAAAAAFEQVAGQLEAIRKALLDGKKEIATELLRKAAPRAQELYGRLVRQPLFDTLDVRVDTKAAKVDYAFAVRSGDATATARDARLVLSDGQLTATALALFFGLAESTAHGLDLLCVDDPTQNLDLASKEAMAKVIAEVALRRQVIVATQDEDFVSFLKASGFPDGAVVHHLKSWDGNPTVETATPEFVATSGKR